jgi:hypothetical protein
MELKNRLMNHEENAANQFDSCTMLREILKIKNFLAVII